jgi:hypothetical protein
MVKAAIPKLNIEKSPGHGPLASTSVEMYNSGVGWRSSFAIV